MFIIVSLPLFPIISLEYREQIKRSLRCCLSPPHLIRWPWLGSSQILYMIGQILSYIPCSCVGYLHSYGYQITVMDIKLRAASPLCTCYVLPFIEQLTCMKCACYLQLLFMDNCKALHFLETVYFSSKLKTHLAHTCIFPHTCTYSKHVSMSICLYGYMFLGKLYKYMFMCVFNVAGVKSIFS